MTLAVVYTFLLFTFKEVKLARSVVSKAEIERAKGIILGIPRSQVTEEGQTVVIYDNPSQAVADEMGCAFSRARHIISKLSEEGLLTYIANGGPAKPNGRRGHAWLVKLPDNGKAETAPPKEQQLKLGTEDSSPGTDVLALIGQLENHVRHLVAENAELREAANTAELLRSDNERLTAEMANLREQHNHVIQTLGRLDEDVLRAIIQKAQRTHAD
jgi:hypothetical protein